MKIKNFTVFASDLNSNTGEGTLGRFFISKIFAKCKNSSIKVITPNQTFFYKGNFKGVQNNTQKNMYHKYFVPIIGAFKLRLLQKNTNIIFLNYLPLWNFLLFLILPSKTYLGPITGSNKKYKVKNLNFFIRNYFFPPFFSLSLVLIKKKFKNIIFSTNLLQSTVEKKTSKKTLKNYLFNFVYSFFDKNLKNKYKFKQNKNLILFYNKNHATKKDINLISFINDISKEHKVSIVGDKFHNQNLNNLGYVGKKRLELILTKTKFVISSNENLLSLFNIEAINNGAFIIYNRKSFERSMYLNSPFLSLNYKNSSIKSFNNLIKNYKKIKIDKSFFVNINKQKSKIELFFNKLYF